MLNLAEFLVCSGNWKWVALKRVLNTHNGTLKRKTNPIDKNMQIILETRVCQGESTPKTSF